MVRLTLCCINQAQIAQEIEQAAAAKAAEEAATAAALQKQEEEARTKIEAEAKAKAEAEAEAQAQEEARAEAAAAAAQARAAAEAEALVAAEKAERVAAIAAAKEKVIAEAMAAHNNWATSVKGSDGRMVTELAPIPALGGLQQVFLEHEFATAVEIVFRHYQHACSNDALTASQFMNFVQDSGLDELAPNQISTVGCSSRAVYDEVFYCCFGVTFKHDMAINLPFFLIALLRLTGIDNAKQHDWTDEAIHRDRLRTVLQRHVRPLAAFVVNEPLQLGEYMDCTVVGLLEEHWQLLQVYALLHINDCTCHPHMHKCYIHIIAQMLSLVYQVLRHLPAQYHLLHVTLPINVTPLTLLRSGCILPLRSALRRQGRAC